MINNPSDLNSHYDETYYREHYAHLINNASSGRLLGEFYKLNVFDRFTPHATRYLDYGSGPGHLTVTVGADCYDPSEFALQFLRQQGRTAYSIRDSIPRDTFDAVFSSHAIEHSIRPAEELATIHGAMTAAGKLILILPIEKSPGWPTRAADNNRHFYCWNFQTVTNLLLECDFVPEFQQVLFAPFLLRLLGRWFPPRMAAYWAAAAGRLKGNYPAILTVAAKRHAK